MKLESNASSNEYLRSSVSSVTNDRSVATRHVTFLRLTIPLGFFVACSGASERRPWADATVATVASAPVTAEVAPVTSSAPSSLVSVMEAPSFPKIRDTGCPSSSCASVCAVPRLRRCREASEFPTAFGLELAANDTRVAVGILASDKICAGVRVALFDRDLAPKKTTACLGGPLKSPSVRMTFSGDSLFVAVSGTPSPPGPTRTNLARLDLDGNLAEELTFEGRVESLSAGAESVLLTFQAQGGLFAAPLGARLGRGGLRTAQPLLGFDAVTRVAVASIGTGFVFVGHGRDGSLAAFPVDRRGASTGEPPRVFAKSFADVNLASDGTRVSLTYRDDDPGVRRPEGQPLVSRSFSAGNFFGTKTLLAPADVVGSGAPTVPIGARRSLSLLGFPEGVVLAESSDGEGSLGGAELLPLTRVDGRTVQKAITRTGNSAIVALLNQGEKRKLELISLDVAE